jgi:hypothetical protein
MRANYVQVLLAAATLAVTSVEAFWGTGHMLGKFKFTSLHI